MTGIHTADAYAVEQVPIQQIEPGEWVVTLKNSDQGRWPRPWRVHAKRLRHYRAAGQPPTIYLCSAAGEDAAAVEAPVGTIILRAVKATPPMHTNLAAAVGGDGAGFRHPKCYANTRGGCSTNISGEHYISHSLIKLYGFGDPTLKIKHDNGFGIRNFVSPKKFVARVLCETHNNGLNHADDAALEFCTFLRTISLRFANGAGDWGHDEEVTISGEDFQAWILKLLLNHVAGKAFTHQRGEVVSPFPPEAIDVLLGRAMWPKNWGMCVPGDLTNPSMRMNPFERQEDVTTEWCTFQPLINNEGFIGGIMVNLNGFSFGLTVFDAHNDEPAVFNIPENPLRGSVQRPKSIAWEINGVTKRINFEYDDMWDHQPITYRIEGD